LALSPIPTPAEAVNKGGRGEVSIYEFLREQEKRLKNYELLRLLYVAATRARRKLVLLAAVEEQPDGELKDPGKGSLLAPLWPTIKAEVRRVYGNGQVELELQSDFALLPLRRFKLEALLKLNEELNTASLEADESSILDGFAHTLEESITNEESEYLRIVGICAHEIFEQIAKLGWSYWRQKNLASLKPHWSIRLAELGMQADEIVMAANSIEIAMTKLMASKHAEMLFSDKHSDAHSEWALTCYEAGQAKRLVLDLSFIDSNHTRWVIDYKMAQPVQSQPQALFLAQQQQQYADKMQQYRKAVERYDQEHNSQVRATRCALYFPMLDNLCEVDAV